MGDPTGDAKLIADIRDSIGAATGALESSAARDEALASFSAGRRVLLFQKSAAFAPIGRVWRLGVFLLDRAGTLYQTGTTTRAVEPGYPGYQSQSAEARRAYRAAAHRAAARNGPFQPGETINFDARVIELDAQALRSSSEALFIRGDRALVRWTPRATDEAAAEFEGYLRERVDLLINAPEGA